jgi:hypothetical protein
MLENTQNIYVVDVPAAPIDAACHENIEMATNLGASYTGFFFHNKKNWYEMKAMQFARVECVKYLYEAALPVVIVWKILKLIQSACCVLIKIHKLFRLETIN